MLDYKSSGARVPITVLGISERESLAPEMCERVMNAQVLAGGARHLARFPDARGERFVIGNNVAELAERLKRAMDANESVIVLASGDPLLFGIGATLRRYFGAEQLEIIPAVSSIQRAFAALGEAWDDALLLSAHGRSLDDVIDALTPLRRAAILTDAVNTPAVIAKMLLERGDDCAAAVCERLGLEGERVVRGRLSEIAQQTFEPLNVMVVLPEVGVDVPRTSESAWHVNTLSERAFGLRDEELEHDGLITALDVRAVAIAALRLKPDSVVWDMGAGSGAVALDTARVAYRGSVYAIERDAVRYERLCRNLKTHEATRVRAFHGQAPEDCAEWSAPDAVFVGGSGGQLENIINYVAQRLRTDGRVVINLVTLDRVAETLSLLRAQNFSVNVTQVSIARSRSLQESVYLVALNPVFVVSAQREKS